MSAKKWIKVRRGLWHMASPNCLPTGWRIEVTDAGLFRVFEPTELYGERDFDTFEGARDFCETSPQPQAIPRKPKELTESDFRITPICDRTEYACWRGGHYTTHPNVFEAVDYARSLVATRRCEITAWEDQYGNLVEWCKEGTDYVYEEPKQ